MAWTTPGTAVAGAVLEADFWNSNVRDNTLALYAQSQYPYRNLLYNGAMQIAQRGTSFASLSTGATYALDRWQAATLNQGTWTVSSEVDAPAATGLKNSLKFLCTSADAAPAAADEVNLNQKLEGQDVQRLLFGTSSAQSLTLTFWVKSNVTGTYIATLINDDASERFVSQAYTISVSGTWEKKSLTFPGDTVSGFNNDNGPSLVLRMHLGAGSNFTSGTLQTAWNTNTPANRTVGQVNVASAINNYWQITGVQLEAGSVSTPFEFLPFGDELARCQRYFISYGGDALYTEVALGAAGATNFAEFVVALPVRMRANPVVSSSGSWQVSDQVAATAVTSFSSDANLTGAQVASLRANVSSGLTQYRPYRLESANSTASRLSFSAEL